MPLTFLLDENLPRRVLRTIERHNLRGTMPLDVVCVGQPDDLPLASDDPSILRWAEREGRILVSADHATLPNHLETHLASGHHSPGVFLARPDTKLSALVGHLALVAHVSEDYEWRDRVEFIP